MHGVTQWYCEEQQKPIELLYNKQLILSSPAATLCGFWSRSGVICKLIYLSVDYR